jgi:hypothetical protein
MRRRQMFSPRFVLAAAPGSGFYLRRVSASRPDFVLGFVCAPLGDSRFPAPIAFVVQETGSRVLQGLDRSYRWVDSRHHFWPCRS